MPRTKLSLSKETLAELTADEMSSVVGGDSNSCSCTILVVCINLPAMTAQFPALIGIRGTTPTMC